MAILKITEKESKQISRRKGLKEAESYGWVVEDYQAQEAYEFACDYFGEDELNSQIVGCISNEELASCLAYIFRMNDFREWDEYLEGNNEEDFDESCRKKSKRKTIKEYADELHGVITCNETGEEYGYNSYQDREYIISDLVEKGYTYKDSPVRVDYSEDRFYDESLKESKENTTYVVFRKYYNEYTDTYEPIAFYWGNDIPATYGSINVTEQDGIVPHMKTPSYIHDEADIRYISKTKKLTSNDECYNDFTKFVIDELSKDGYNVAVKQKVDYNAVRNSWRR